MAIRWTSALAIGVPDLDAQHEELFRRVDRLHDAMLARDRAEAGELIRFLQSYVAEHLAAEERLMRETRYPDEANHLAEHASFAAEIDDLAETLADEGVTPRLVLRLAREVSGWLQNHICTTDVALGRHVVGHRTPARPPRPSAARSP
jgi:hemerythrin